MRSRFALLVLTLLALSGCGSVGFVPETPRESLAATWAAINAAADTVRSAHAAGFLSTEQKDTAKRHLQSAVRYAEAAQEAVIDGIADAETSNIRRAYEALELVNDLLDAYQEARNDGRTGSDQDRYGTGESGLSGRRVALEHRGEGGAGEGRGPGAHRRGSEADGCGRIGERRLALIA